MLLSVDRNGLADEEVLNNEITFVDEECMVAEKVPTDEDALVDNVVWVDKVDLIDEDFPIDEGVLVDEGVVINEDVLPGNVVWIDVVVLIKEAALVDETVLIGKGVLFNKGDVLGGGMLEDLIANVGSSCAFGVVFGFGPFFLPFSSEFSRSKFPDVCILTATRLDGVGTPVKETTSPAPSAGWTGCKAMEVLFCSSKKRQSTLKEVKD